MRSVSLGPRLDSHGRSGTRAARPALALAAAARRIPLHGYDADLPFRVVYPDDAAEVEERVP